MLRRRQSREAALQMLYQHDLNPDVDYHTVRELIKERLPDDDLAEFAWHLFIGVVEHRMELDAKIEAIAQNWSLKRMAPTDRNALRLGAYEILHTSTPPRVAIDEALELAKMFGSGQSAPFVNGILDRMVPPERRAELTAPNPDREVQSREEPPAMHDDHDE